MSDLKIRVFKGDTQQLTATVTIPAGVVRFAAKLVPASAIEAMRKEGIDFAEIIKLSENATPPGKIAEVMNHEKNERVVVSLE